MFSLGAEEKLVMSLDDLIAERQKLTAAAAKAKNVVTSSSASMSSNYSHKKSIKSKSNNVAESSSHHNSGMKKKGKQDKVEMSVLTSKKKIDNPKSICVVRVLSLLKKS